MFGHLNVVSIFLASYAVLLQQNGSIEYSKSLRSTSSPMDLIHFLTELFPISHTSILTCAHICTGWSVVLKLLIAYRLRYDAIPDHEVPLRTPYLCIPASRQRDVHFLSWTRHIVRGKRSFAFNLIDTCDQKALYR